MKTSVAITPISSFTLKGLTLLLAGLVMASTVRSQTAGNWNFNNTLTGTPGSNITVSSFSLGSAIPSSSFNSGVEYYGEGGWPSGALDPNAYNQFTVTSNSGYYLVLNSISLVQRRSSTGTSGAGPNTWSLRSSLDNYTTDIATGSLTIAYVTSTITLPAAFQSIPSTITFRVYGYNMTISSGGTSRFVFDNISVQGQAISGVLAQQSIDLTAKSTAQGSIALSWQTEGFATGTNFILQRSTNGADFNAIYQTQDTDNTSFQYHFQYRDGTASTTLFYRVAATQPDGTIYLSTVVAIRQNVASQTRIRGVVTQGSSIRTLLHVEEAGAYQLTIRSADGRAVLKQTVQVTAGDPVTELTLGSYPHGVYILTLSNEEDQSSRQFVY